MKNVWVLTAALYLLPLLAFFEANILTYDAGYLLPSVFITTAFALASLIILMPLRLIRGVMLFTKACFFVATLWYLQFYLNALPTALSFQTFAPPPKIALIVLLSFFATALLRYELSRTFFFIFLLLNVFLSSISISSAYVSKKSQQVANTVVSVRSAATGFPKIQSDKSVRALNVYYVIADGLPSPKILKEKLRIDITDFTERLKGYGFYVPENSWASYNMTHLTLAAIFNQHHFLHSGSPQYFDLRDFFPGMLAATDNLPLLDNLSTLGFDFVHIGNSWTPCTPVKNIRCADSYMPLDRDYVAELATNYVLNVFLKESPFWRIFLARSKEKISKQEARSKDALRSASDNDAISILIKVLKSNPAAFQEKKKFVFVHHLNPHSPFRDKECNVLPPEKQIERQVEQYQTSSLCALKRLRELIDVIEANDPDSIVVLQGDHGSNLSYDFDVPYKMLRRDELAERLAKFNAIKVPNQCGHELIDKLDNVGTINLVVSCIAGIKFDYIEPKSFVGFYEKHPEFGFVKEVELDKLETLK